MLKPDDLRAMPPEDQTQLFDALCRTYYGTSEYAPKLSADLDVARSTIFRWKADNRTPWAVLFTLDQWVHGEAMDQKLLEEWRSLPAQLSDAARHLGSVATTLSQIARRLPASRDDAAASSSLPQAGPDCQPDTAEPLQASEPGEE